MPALQDIIRSIHGLSQEDKLALRNILEDELQAAKEVPAKKSSVLIGLFSDRPDALDGVDEAYRESRSRPLRID